MEIYRNITDSVKIRLFNGTSLIHGVEASFEGEDRKVVSSSLIAGPHAEIVLTPDLVDKNGSLKFYIDFEDSTGGRHTAERSVDVVTPLFTREDFDDPQYESVNVEELERLIRKIVEAYTGQVFAPFKDSYSSNTSDFSFRAPIIEFTGVSKHYPTGASTLNIGHVIYENSMGLKLLNYHPKYDAYVIPGTRDRDCKFVTGIFGYEEVPVAVKEAALLIAGVWGCSQAIWYDRYIKTIRTANMSVGYEQGSSKSTGSRAADSLLEQYVSLYSSGGAVI